MLCYLGLHKSDVVLNLKTNRITKICKKCKIILEVAKDSSCCGSCIAKDMNWKIQLKKLGKIIDV